MLLDRDERDIDSFELVVKVHRFRHCIQVLCIVNCQHLFDNAYDSSCTDYACQTSKKKFFVVRAETSSGPARLEYYDTEKKFHSGGLARRCILLKNCFSINAKSDSMRHRHMIVLYTEDDCFGIACGSESEQQEWLNTMVLLRCQSLNSSSRSTAAYSK